MARKNKAEDEIKEVVPVVEKEIKADLPKIPKEVEKITLQHIGRVRQFTVKGEDVLKVHRGHVPVVDEAHDRFKLNKVINPGAVLDVTPKLAKTLLSTGDFQKYGVEAEE